jgi:UDP-glucose 4-epimerase
LTTEEAAKAEDLGDYFRVPADNRDLNYDVYFSEGIPKTAQVGDYHSNNARRLSLEEMMELLLTLPEMREAMGRRGLKARSANIER